MAKYVDVAAAHRDRWARRCAGEQHPGDYDGVARCTVAGPDAVLRCSNSLAPFQIPADQWVMPVRSSWRAYWTKINILIVAPSRCRQSKFGRRVHAGGWAVGAGLPRWMPSHWLCLKH